MCGIVGIYGSNDATTGLRMLHRLQHRGPDGRGALALANAWLGHCRLSIVDPAGGRQPLTTEDGRLHMVGNGEIYNHRHLRSDLPHVYFESQSDNEVALKLVEDEGPSALKKLTGMFAVLIAGPGVEFLAARDPVGIKPLYWARKDEEVRFASEIRAFDSDWQSSVDLFPPGHYWTPDTGLVRFARPVLNTGQYEFAPPKELGVDAPAELVDALRETVVDAVQRWMMADVPVGVFLSGGLDSSIVAAIAARTYKQEGLRLKTFSIGSADSPDLRTARLVADYLDTDHYERVFTAEQARDILPETIRIIENFDPSLVRSAVPNYFLSELAAEHVKVVLTGEGVDELFAGYAYQQNFGGEAALQQEIVRTVESLHGLNLQRCDRVTMFHGLEARVPFLDPEVIDFCVSIPTGWKMRGANRPEKWLLRKAFEGWIPDEILWRKKAEFGDGSGAATVLKQGIGGEPVVALEELAHQARSEEEATYYEIFRRHFGEVSPDRTLTLFATP